MVYLTNPFTLIKEQVDPQMAAANENGDMLDFPLANLFTVEDYKGVQPSAAGFVDIWQATARPSINIGDYWAYQHGDRDLAQGRIKFQKMTINQTLTEDEYDRIAQLGYADSIVAKGMLREAKENAKYLMSTVELYLIDPWAGVTTSKTYDSTYQGVLAGSSSGTLSAPSDLNASAGTAYSTPEIALSGSEKTANNAQQIATTIRAGMTKVDFITKRKFSFKKFYFVVDPITLAIIKTQHDLLNSTTGQVSNNVLYDDLLSMGIECVESALITYASAPTDETTMTGIAFADPEEWFTIFHIPPPEGEGWTEWTKTPSIKGDVTKYVYERHRKFEFSIMVTAFYMNTSATAGSFFKPVFRMTVTPYDM
jgi:hypothetical protein